MSWHLAGSRRLALGFWLIALLAATGAKAECEADGTGGMFGFGWDGFGEGAAALYWHVEGWTPDAGATGQRNQTINALQAWANVAQISFQEVAVANLNQSIDFNFATGDHSDIEPQEAGDPHCPFTTQSGHAAKPPTAVFISDCPNLSTETFSGNVHLNENKDWDDEEGPGWSLRYAFTHEVGHALGLAHSGDGFDVMYCAGYDWLEWIELGANDILNIQNGYAAGTGTVQTLEDLGIFVDRTPAVPSTQWGTLAFPFDTVQEGVDGVPPFAEGVDVYIQAGFYPETLTIDAGPTGRTMTLRALGAWVTIGQ